MRHDVYCPQRLKDGRYIVYKLKSFLGIKWWTPIPSLYIQLDSYTEEKEELESRLKVVKDAIRAENARIDTFIKASLDSFNAFYNVSSKRKYANVSVDDDGQRKEIVVTEKHIIPNDVIVCGIGDHKPSNNHNNQQNHNKPKQ